MRKFRTYGSVGGRRVTAGPIATPVSTATLEQLEHWANNILDAKTLEGRLQEQLTSYARVNVV